MRTFELVTIIAELAVGCLAGLAFVVAYWSSPWGRTSAGRHMMAVAAVMAGEMGTLLVMVLGVPVPVWLFVVGYAAADAVVIHRLVLLWRSKRQPATPANDQSVEPQEGT